MSAFLPLARYFAASAARVAIRSSALGLLATFFWIGLATPNLPYALRELAWSLTSHNGGPGALALFAALGLGLATQAVRRFRVGLTGWARSLPASGVTVRRAVWAGLLIVQAPLVILYLAAVAAVATASIYHAPLAPARLAGFALALGGAAALAGAVVCHALWRRLAIGALAAGAILGATSARWAGVIIAVAALALADRIVGPVRAPGRSAPTRHVRWPSPRTLAITLAWRALGPTLVTNALGAVLPLIAAGFFRANNEDLAPGSAALALRIGAALSLAIYTATLATALAARRPPWRWVRALPWSGAQRVAADAIALGLPGAALVTPVLFVDVASGALTLLHAPAYAYLAAAALRHTNGRPSGATGEALRFGVPLALVWSIWPASLVTLPAVIALAAWSAVRRERSQRVSTFEELHHQTAGDPEWIAR
ncbi:MAG: hypothetical protein WKG32_23215 [Gemmatimonadaceae bacterium]